LGFLQKSNDLPEVIPVSCAEEHPTTSHEGTEVINIKVEEGTDVQRRVVPVPITFALIKAENEVSSVSVLSHITHVSPNIIFLCESMRSHS
jgi:hypothetical protein